MAAYRCAVCDYEYDEGTVRSIFRLCLFFRIILWWEELEVLHFALLGSVSLFSSPEYTGLVYAALAQDLQVCQRDKDEFLFA